MTNPIYILPICSRSTVRDIRKQLSESQFRLDDTNPSKFPSELDEDEDQSVCTHRTTSDLVIQQAVPCSTSSRCLQIIAQPICSAGIKYRRDYTGTQKRRGALINKNSGSSFTGPAINVSEFHNFHLSTKDLYLDLTGIP